MPTVLITGANRGIGLALARHYSQYNYNVIGVCRQTNEALDACCSDVISDIDIQSDEAVKCLTDVLADHPIDLLISNAGILEDEQLNARLTQPLPEMDVDFETLEAIEPIHSPKFAVHGDSMETDHTWNESDHSVGDTPPWEVSAARRNTCLFAC